MLGKGWGVWGGSREGTYGVSSFFDGFLFLRYLWKGWWVRTRKSGLLSKCRGRGRDVASRSTMLSNFRLEEG